MTWPGFRHCRASRLSGGLPAALVFLIVLASWPCGGVAVAAGREVVHVEGSAVCKGSRPDLCRDDGSDCTVRAACAQPCECADGYGAQVLRSVDDPRYPGMESLVYTCCPGRDNMDCGSYSVAGRRRFKVAGAVLLAAGLAGAAATSCWLARGGPPRAAAAASKGAVEVEPVPGDEQVLHQQVPMSMWCVTRDDLIHLRRSILCAVRDRRIRPTDLDPFDPGDIAVGPNIHSVVAQYIKPITAAAGGMSWALMRHPLGLECDLFVSHCWAEGIFEFIDKVVHSWPRGARHAYCCMLSNPQASDGVDGLIANPLQSPFAHALQSASHVLAVPNETCSIYSRVWCAFEAYLAYSWDKTIETAVPPVRHMLPKVLQAASAYLTVAGAVWLCMYDFHAGMILVGISLFAATVVAMASHRVRPEREHVTWALGIMLFAAMAMFGAIFPWVYPGIISAWVMFVAIGCGACAHAADILWVREAALQARQLRQGYTGRISDAESSRQSDRQRIQALIKESGSEWAVDRAVAALIHMGMSSPHLRQASRLVGELGNARDYRLGYVVLSCLILIVEPFVRVELRAWRLSELFSVRLWSHCLHHALVITEGIVYAVVFVRAPRDRKAFVAKSSVLFLPLFCLVVIGWIWDCVHNTRYMIDVMWAGPEAFTPLFLCGVVAGPANVARVPLLGPALVRFILGPAKTDGLTDGASDDESGDDDDEDDEGADCPTDDDTGQRTHRVPLWCWRSARGGGAN